MAISNRDQNVSPELESFFDQLWQDYLTLTPQAGAIAELFATKGSAVVNDHVAFRTVSDSPIAMAQLEKILIELGYRAYDDFRFERKKLNAKAYQWRHPDAAPKIFLSELQLAQLPQAAADILLRYIDQIPKHLSLQPQLLCQGCLWAAPWFEDYQSLHEHSEYAAWLLTMGLRANHFTVSVNHLAGAPSLAQVNEWLKQSGYKLNAVGGEIKRGPAHTLEQSATLAQQQPYRFADGNVRLIPTCFYEFALRHTMPSGELYPSFVEGNADKIFESTHAR